MARLLVILMVLVEFFASGLAMADSEEVVVSDFTVYFLSGGGIVWQGDGSLGVGTAYGAKVEMLCWPNDETGPALMDSVSFVVNPSKEGWSAATVYSLTADTTVVDSMPFVGSRAQGHSFETPVRGFKIVFNLRAGGIFRLSEPFYYLNGERYQLYFDDSVRTAIEATLMPTKFALHQNYPNPFNPTTTIGFDLPVGDHVRVDIYDATGRLVATLANRHFDAGANRVKWNGTDGSGLTVPSGVYFARVQAGEHVAMVTMTLQK